MFKVDKKKEKRRILACQMDVITRLYDIKYYRAQSRMTYFHPKIFAPNHITR